MSKAPGRRGRPLRKTCTVCQHPEVHRIEAERAAGVSFGATSAWSGVHEDALWRHWHNHVPPERKAQYLVDIPFDQLLQRATSERGSLLDYLALLRKQLFDLFLAASGAGDAYRAATLAGRIKEVLQLTGTVTGEVETIARSTTVNIHLTRSPAYARLQEALITALQPHPEAMQAVMTALRRVEIEEVGTASALPVIDAVPKEVSPDAAR